LDINPNTFMRNSRNDLHTKQSPKVTEQQQHSKIIEKAIPPPRQT